MDLPVYGRVVWAEQTKKKQKKVVYVCRTRYKGIRLFSGEQKKNDTLKRRLCAPTTNAM